LHRRSHAHAATKTRRALPDEGGETVRQTARVRATPIARCGTKRSIIYVTFCRRYVYILFFPEKSDVASKKEQCKALMAKAFGPATAALVDSMTEEECVAKCRAKVKGFWGEEKAKEFDKIV
jgi:hypothetical protein